MKTLKWWFDSEDQALPVAGGWGGIIIVGTCVCVVHLHLSSVYAGTVVIVKQ